MKLLLVFFFPGAGLLVAQASDGGEFNPLSLVGQLGFGAGTALMFWMWREERKERQASEARERALTERFGPLLASAADTLREVQEGLQATALGGPAASALDLTVRRLELAIDEVRSERGRGR